jgi:hypothetical protein
MEGNEHVELELPTKETVPGSYMVDGYQTENKQPETNAANAIYEHLLASPALQHPVHSAPDIEPSPPSIVEPGHGQDESTSQSRNVPYFTEENSWIRLLPPHLQTNSTLSLFLICLEDGLHNGIGKLEDINSSISIAKLRSGSFPRGTTTESQSRVVIAYNVDWW